MLNAEDELDLLSDDESTKNLFGNLQDSALELEKAAP